MKQLCVSSRDQWRAWLAANHDKEVAGVWLVFYKRATGRASLEYEAAVEEALCFGWIDSIVRKIDSQKYCRKFTPRKDASSWSPTNKVRVARLIKTGQMTPIGLAKVRMARNRGTWDTDRRPGISGQLPVELADALARAENSTARVFFESLAPSYQRQYIGWLITAKRPETKALRLKEALRLLRTGRKLGLK